MNKTLTGILMASSLMIPTQTFGQEENKVKQIQYTQELNQQFNYILNRNKELIQIQSAMPKNINFENENFYCIQRNKFQNSLKEFHNLFSSEIEQFQKTDKIMDLIGKIQTLNQRIELAYKSNDIEAIKNLNTQYNTMMKQEGAQKANTIFKFNINRLKSEKVLKEFNGFPRTCQKKLEKITDDLKMENFIKPKK
jgi:hypothetical protein